MTRASYRLLGWTRLRAALLTAVLAATLITLFTSLPAHADPPSPSPTPTAPAPATPSTPTEEELAEIQEILDAQAETRSKAEQQAAMEAEAEKLRKALPDEGGVLGVFNVTDVNNLPISVYRVKGDTGGFTRWDLGLLNLGTEFLFTVTKWVIAFSCWLIGWALSFGLAKLLLGPVLAVAESLHARVIMEMGLPALFLAVCAVVVRGADLLRQPGSRHRRRRRHPDPRRPHHPRSSPHRPSCCWGRRPAPSRPPGACPWRSPTSSLTPRPPLPGPTARTPPPRRPASPSPAR
ncbi:hypothetical protein Sgou_32290 [Streptomyces gougerotii]|uniref:Uncharacterized protein n=1 Tax=Streptomyces gougerotii TaxID=53448 RepID=A0ABQ1D7L9_9ACTN|nr:hypothetical protein [Streptomyces gougerotii]GFH78559.1 hypothetical protein Sgou_32290 [Streptomyces gougerotii]